MKMKASITLFGTCTLYNVFRSAAEEGKSRYLIKNSFFQVSPIALVMGEPVAPLLDIEFKGTLEAETRSTKVDIHKNFFQELERKKSDYFIIELNECDRSIIQIEYAGHIYYLSRANGRISSSSPNVLKVLESVGAAYKIIEQKDYFDLYEKEIGLFCDKLLELYPPEKVILVRTYPTNLCIRRDFLLDKIKDVAPDRRFIDEATRIFTERMNGCHVIDPLKYMISAYNANCRFAIIHPYHYDKNYDDYCLECINVITDSLPAEQEEEKLSELWKYYSAKTEETYFSGLDKLIHKNDMRSRNYSYEEFYSRKIEAIEENTWLEKVRVAYDIEKMISPLHAHGKELHQIIDLNEYIKFVAENSKGYVLFFAVGDNVGTHWGRFTSKSLISLTQQVKRATSYIASVDIDDQNTVELYNETHDELKYQCSITVKDQNVLTNFEMKNAQPVFQYHVSISSKGWEPLKADGIYLHWAKILINNVEYSMNKRGLNVVVFSKRDQCVVDCFYVDMFSDENLTILRQ